MNTGNPARRLWQEFSPKMAACTRTITMWMAKKKQIQGILKRLNNRMWKLVEYKEQGLREGVWRPRGLVWAWLEEVATWWVGDTERGAAWGANHEFREIKFLWNIQMLMEKSTTTKTNNNLGSHETWERGVVQRQRFWRPHITVVHKTKNLDLSFGAVWRKCPLC